MRSGDWFCTYTGKQYWLTDPHPDDVDITDIAHALSQICRFGGHSREFYSVAQHCVHCVQALRECGIVHTKTLLDALLHDASEAYIGDIVRPLKQTMKEYLRVEEQTTLVIYSALGLESPGEDAHGLIKRADNALLLAERRDLLNCRNTPSWKIDETPWSGRIIPWGSRVSEDAFMRNYFELREQIAREVAPTQK